MACKYSRVLLKLSGETLSGDGAFGICSNKLSHYADEIKKVVELGTQVAVVIGGGNIFRGTMGVSLGMSRVQADNTGMLATAINALALQSSLEKMGVETRVQTAVHMNQIAEPFIRRRAIRHLEKGRVVIFAGGTGNPYFTTDTAAVLRAIEVEADVVLKGTRVEGIYSEDPEKSNSATLFKSITFSEVLKNNVNVMDSTAFTLSMENMLPIMVFNINGVDNFKKLVLGEQIGTIVVSE